MAEPLIGSASSLSERSIAVALITLTRYLARSDSNFLDYLSASLAHAETSGLTGDDLAMLRLLIGSVGR